MYFEGDVRDLGPVDPVLLDRLEAALRAQWDLWETQDRLKPNRFECFTHTSHIVFRFPLQLDTHERSVSFPLWTAWAPLIEPIIDRVVPYYGYASGRTARVMLAKLAAGGSIDAHVDKGASCEVPHKIHVPLITHPEVRFWQEDRPYYLERGRAYEVNNRIRHSVTNDAAIDRVHLIFDYFEAAPAGRAASEPSTSTLRV